MLDNRHEEAARLLEQVMDLKLTSLMAAQVSWVRVQLLAAQGKVAEAWALIGEMEADAARGGCSYSGCFPAFDVATADWPSSVPSALDWTRPAREIEASQTRYLWTRAR